MRRTLIRRDVGPGLALLGDGVRGFYGRAPDPKALAYLLYLEHQVAQARRLALAPQVRQQRIRRLGKWRAQLGFQQTQRVSWGEAAWICILAEPSNPLLRALLDRFAAGARVVGARRNGSDGHADG